MTKQNLDRLCAEYGYKIAEQVHSALKKSAENHITKSLGVLQANGVYAFFLYQASRGKKEQPGAKKLITLAAELLNEKEVALLEETSEPLEAIRKAGGLADNLDDLLLAKRLLEQALIYARYHAKALGG